MTIVLRNTKGSSLTYSELDGNFTDLINQVAGKLSLTGGTVTGNLNVTGLLTFGGGFSTTSGALSSTLNVSGNSTLAALSATTGNFSSTLNVTGVSTLTAGVIASTYWLRPDTLGPAVYTDGGGTDDIVLRSGNSTAGYKYATLTPAGALQNMKAWDGVTGSYVTTKGSYLKWATTGGQVNTTADWIFGESADSFTLQRYNGTTWSAFASWDSSGNFVGAGNITAGNILFTSPFNSAWGIYYPGLVVQTAASGGTVANIGFLRQTFYGLDVGLDSDNAFKIGGWSQGTGVFRFTLDTAGNGVFSGNVTAYSDGRDKQDWKPLVGIKQHLLGLKNWGSYTDVRSGERKVGVVAQDFLRIMPEAVLADYSIGRYSFAYGQAAMTALVAYAQENENDLLMLKNEIATIKSQLKV